MDYIKLITAKKEEKMKAVTEARTKVEAATTEKRSMTGEEEAFYSKAMDTVVLLDKEIRRFEQLMELEKGAITKETETRSAESEIVSRDGRKEHPEYKSAFMDVLTGRRAMQDVKKEFRVGTGMNEYLDSDRGAILAPPTFETKIIDTIIALTTMRKLATITTTSALTKIPFVTSKPTAYWTAEEGSYTPSRAVFSTKDLSAFKLTALTQISEELMNDALIPIEPEIVAGFGYAFAVAEEDKFFNGAGTTEPRGVLTDAVIGVTSANATAITADEIFEMFHSVRWNFRDKASWVMTDEFAKMIRKLKDSTGRYIWQEGLQAGQPDSLLSKPVYITEALAAVGASAYPALFGDFSYYRIGDRVGMYFQRLMEIYAANGQVGLRAYKRLDGLLLDANAVKKFKMHA